jgi:hypothetical protein
MGQDEQRIRAQTQPYSWIPFFTSLFCALTPSLCERFTSASVFYPTILLFSNTHQILAWVISRANDAFDVSF